MTIIKTDTQASKSDGKMPEITDSAEVKACRKQAKDQSFRKRAQRAAASVSENDEVSTSLSKSSALDAGLQALSTESGIQQTALTTLAPAAATSTLAAQAALARQAALPLDNAGSVAREQEGSIASSSVAGSGAMSIQQTRRVEHESLSADPSVKQKLIIKMKTGIRSHECLSVDIQCR